MYASRASRRHEVCKQLSVGTGRAMHYIAGELTGEEHAVLYNLC